MKSFTRFLNAFTTKSCIVLAALLLGYVFPAQAQLSIEGTPPSFENRLQKAVPTEVMPSIPDLQVLEAEDAINDAKGTGPWRFAIPFSTNLSLDNSGTWETMKNGDHIWRLNISCAGAKNINLLYENFYLPKGAELYLYSGDQKQVIGAFTYQNNKVDRRFATELIYDDFLTIEYYEPAKLRGQGSLTISQVAHGYRGFTLTTEGDDDGYVVEDIGDSGNCQVNVNCSPEGDNWQNEKKGVAKITVGGSDWCSGSLMNNTAQDCTPYFLTAHHCRAGRDAVSNPIASNWVFYWNFEYPGCANTGVVPTQTTAGATFLSNAASSDFALLLLTEDPATSYDVYYNGFNATNTIGVGGVGIHHPSGDVKKIATHNLTPTNASWSGSPANSHWRVAPWLSTPNGFSVTEGGSSGSPLFDANHLVIGQLHGGSSINCNNPAADPGVYGKLSWSWTNSNNPSNARRVDVYLDPVNGGAQTMLGGSADPCAVAACDISIDGAVTAATSCIGGADGQITISASCTSCIGIEYSIDGINYQASPVFMGQTAGTYDLYVRDSGDPSCNDYVIGGATVDDGPLPCGWDAYGINCSASANYDIPTSTWNLTSEGCYNPSFYRTWDALGMTTTELCGSGEIIAEVTGVSGNGWAGIAMRDGTGSSDKMIQLMIDGSFLSRRELRTTTGGTSYTHLFQTAGRNWLRLTRSGNTFGAYHSTDGSSWQPVLITNISMNTCIEIGLVTMNSAPSGPVTGTFDNVSVSGLAPLMGNNNNLTYELENQHGHSVNIFPNPSSGELNVELHSLMGQNAEISIYNSLGQMLKTISIDEVQHGVQSIDVSNLRSGTYLMRIETTDEKITKRFIVANSN